MLSALAMCLLSLVLTVEPGMAGAGQQQAPPFSPAEVSQMLGYFLANFDISGTGAVVASPSTSEPDYYYHWVRDAAISMHVMLAQLGGIGNGQALQLLQRYTGWEINAQNQQDPNGIDILGEPKYFIPSGKAYDGPWGRPQNDGPALRAIVLTDFANQLLQQPGGADYVLKYLYRPSLSDPGCIKTDLEYVAHHWQDDSFCLWEEVNGRHFFTRMVQRKAMLVGANLADRMNDTGASSYYRQQAQSLESAIRQHWNPSTGVIMATLPPHGGPQKFEELDTAVYLGVLYGHVDGDSLYPPTDPQVVATIARLTTVFRDGSFPINQKDDQLGVPGTLYGRYPNDSYTGTGNGKGNPWFLTTNALADIYYRQAKQLRAEGFRLTAEHREAFGRLLKRGAQEMATATAEEIAAALAGEADNLLLRIRHHCQQQQFHMPEQINYITGDQQGAHDLTWSYGTVLSAMLSR